MKSHCCTFKLKIESLAMKTNLFSSIPMTLFLLSILLNPIESRAQFSATLETGLAGFSRNEARIPGDTGTTIDFTRFDSPNALAVRIIPSYKFSKNHEVRGLWAPLSFEATGRLSGSTSFNGTTFAAGVDTVGSYKFNSYRLGYVYHFNPDSAQRWRLGLMAKIRDAYISVTQGATTSKKSNVGFVPLIHFGWEADFSKDFTVNLDVDALGASQGRAIDGLIAVKYRGLVSAYMESANLYLGYRTIEGGADVEEVYNFAWIHQAVVGLEMSL